MNAILQELKRIADVDELKETAAAQSRELEAWARKKFPSDQTPTARTIENGIRSVFRIYKNERHLRWPRV
jgi:ectoine hydroxylase-related dioxygenase (phytanoyl-CoA dioxygenase family)